MEYVEIVAMSCLMLLVSGRRPTVTAIVVCCDIIGFLVNIYLAVCPCVDNLKNNQTHKLVNCWKTGVEPFYSLLHVTHSRMSERRVQASALHPLPLDSWCRAGAEKALFDTI